MNLLDMYIQCVEDALSLGQAEIARQYLQYMNSFDLQPYQRVLVHDLANRIQIQMFEECT